MKIKVGVAQYDVPESVEASFEKIQSVARNAREKGVQLLVAPETAIGMLADVRSNGTDYLPQLQAVAQQEHIAIATSFYQKEENQLFNHGFIVSEKGAVLLDHRKLYPAPSELDENIQSGNTLENVSTPLGRLGMIICKDGFTKYSHFLYQKFNDDKTDIICIPSWSIGFKKRLGVTNEEYIKTFYVYGAYVSRSFVLVSGNLNTTFASFGRSLMVSPIHGVLQEGSRDKEELLIQELDLDEVKKAREFDVFWQPKERII